MGLIRSIPSGTRPVDTCSPVDPVRWATPLRRVTTAVSRDNRVSVGRLRPSARSIASLSSQIMMTRGATSPLHETCFATRLEYVRNNGVAGWRVTEIGLGTFQSEAQTERCPQASSRHYRHDRFSRRGAHPAGSDTGGRILDHGPRLEPHRRGHSGCRSHPLVRRRQHDSRRRWKRHHRRLRLRQHRLHARRRRCLPGIGWRHEFRRRWKRRRPRDRTLGTTTSTVATATTN